jgi:hypothetical protein
MSAPQGAPEAGSYRFVLRKIAPHDPTFEELVSGYDDAAKSRDVTHPDGVRRRTVYVNSEPFRDRLLRQGWEDVTGLAAKAAKRKGPAPVVRVAG